MKQLEQMGRGPAGTSDTVPMSKDLGDKELRLLPLWFWWASNLSS